MGDALVSSSDPMAGVAGAEAGLLQSEVRRSLSVISVLRHIAQSCTVCTWTARFILATERGHASRCRSNVCLHGLAICCNDEEWLRMLSHGAIRSVGQQYI